MSNKPKFSSGIEFGNTDFSAGAIADIAKSDPGGFAGKIDKAINSGGLRFDKIQDLPRLYHQLSKVRVKTMVSDVGERFAVTTSAFPLLVGGLTVAALNDKFQATPTIGEQLTTPLNDAKRTTVLAAVNSLDNNVDEVKETEDFPEIGASEEKYEIRHRKNGRLLRVSKEMIAENDIAGILDRVDALAEISSKHIETLTLRRVFDIDGSGTSAAEPYVLRLNGSATSLYTTTANNPGTGAPSGTRINNNALVDETDLDAALQRLATMRDSLNERLAINTSELQLVVPFALAGTAMKLLNSEMQPGVENEINAWGPRGQWRPKLVMSPRIDDFSTSVWYLGNFPKQFTRKWKSQLEYQTLGMDAEAYLRAEIAFQARISWDCEVGARDYRYVVQNLSATTAP